MPANPRAVSPVIRVTVGVFVTVGVTLLFVLVSALQRGLFVVEIRRKSCNVTFATCWRKMEPAVQARRRVARLSTRLPGGSEGPAGFIRAGMDRRDSCRAPGWFIFFAVVSSVFMLRLP